LGLLLQGGTSGAGLIDDRGAIEEEPFAEDGVEGVLFIDDARDAAEEADLALPVEVETVAPVLGEAPVEDLSQLGEDDAPGLAVEREHGAEVLRGDRFARELWEETGRSVFRPEAGGKGLRGEARQGVDIGKRGGGLNEFGLGGGRRGNDEEPARVRGDPVGDGNGHGEVDAVEAIGLLREREPLVEGLVHSGERWAGHG
jgi:hypothetical protein